MRQHGGRGLKRTFPCVVEARPRPRHWIVALENSRETFALSRWMVRTGHVLKAGSTAEARTWRWPCPRPLLLVSNGNFGAAANVGWRDELLCADLAEFGLECGAAANHRVAGEICERLRMPALAATLEDPLVRRHTCDVAARPAPPPPPPPPSSGVAARSPGAVAVRRGAVARGSLVARRPTRGDPTPRSPLGPVSSKGPLAYRRPRRRILPFLGRPVSTNYRRRPRGVAATRLGRVPRGVTSRSSGYARRRSSPRPGSVSATTRHLASSQVHEDSEVRVHGPVAQSHRLL